MTMCGWLEVFSGTYGSCLRNPAPVDRWFIPLSSIIYRVSTIQGDAGLLPSTVLHIEKLLEPLGLLALYLILVY